MIRWHRRNWTVSPKFEMFFESAELLPQMAARISDMTGLYCECVHPYSTSLVHASPNFLLVGIPVDRVRIAKVPAHIYSLKVHQLNASKAGHTAWVHPYREESRRINSFLSLSDGECGRPGLLTTHPTRASLEL